MYRRRSNYYSAEIYTFDRRKRRLIVVGFTFLFLAVLGLALGRSLGGKAGKPAVNTGRTAEKLLKLSGYPPLARLPGANVTIYLPAEVNKVVTIGYHEAERPTTYSMQPLGYCVGNENKRRMDGAAPIAKGQLPFFVLNTRGRRATATSAVDVAVTPGAEIRSPVDGEVTKVKSYYLYGKYPDFHVEIMPQGHPEIRIALIHLDNLQVKVGDKTEHGVTALGNIRQFERYLRSQIDKYTCGSFGHLHLQVNPFVEQEENGVGGT